MRGVARAAGTALLASLLFAAADRTLPLLLAPFAQLTAALLLLALLGAAVATLKLGAGRRVTLAAGAVLALSALAAPSPVADSIALAAGTVWLGGACALVGAAPFAFGIAAGLALQPAAPLLAASTSANMAIAPAALLLGLWSGRPDPPARSHTLERRAPALRRRGLIAFGALLLLARSIRGSIAGSTPQSTSMLLVLTAGSLLLLFTVAQLRAAWPQDRRTLAGMVGLAVGLLLASPRLPPVAPALLGVAHALVVVLAARALVPLAVRRSRAWVALAWSVWLVLAGVASPLPAAMAPVLAGAVAALALTLLPRPGSWRAGAPDVGEEELPDVRARVQ